MSVASCHPVFVLVIGPDNAAEPVVTTTSPSSEIRKCQPSSSSSALNRFEQAAAACGGQVNLSYVSSDTALELKPSRVTNIFICSEVVFWASSRNHK